MALFYSHIDLMLNHKDVREREREREIILTNSLRPIHYLNKEYLNCF